MNGNKTRKIVLDETAGGGTIDCAELLDRLRTTCDSRMIWALRDEQRARPRIQPTNASVISMA